MKGAVICLLVCVAVLAQAQDLQYEQAAYTDAAAPVPIDMQDESSFAENDASIVPGEFSKAAKSVGAAIKNVKSLFAARKGKGGNISPSAPPKPRKAIRRGARKAHRKAVKTAKQAARLVKKANKKLAKVAKIAAKAGLKRPIIVKVAKPSKFGKKGARRGRRGARRAGRRNNRVGRLLSRAKATGRRLPRAPAAASGDNIWHSERIIPKNSPNRDPAMAKLNLALAAVKEDILSTNKQINDERRWVIAVSKIITSYNTKMKRVEAHIISLRKEMKKLYRKKKQIENLKLQHALEAKLKEAKRELKTLTNSLKHVAKKQGQLNKSGRDLRNTIAGIQGQLAKLRGQKMRKRRACKKGKRYSKKAKKCVSICKSKQQIYSKKSRKCVRRCKKGAQWNAKAKKCLRSKRSKKGSR